jgi:hypothetical protein
MLTRTSKRRSLKLATLFILIALALLTASPISAKDSKGNSGILPPQSHPYGHTYGEWAVRWWQWALETPASINPLTDKKGMFCAQNQSGDVWFLAGEVRNGAVMRECTVPNDKALFFPLLNSAYFAYLNDPPQTRTEEYIRAQTVCSEPKELVVTIDGVAVSDPVQYHEESPLFDVQLPEDNIFGATTNDIPQLLLSPSVDQGYYLFLAPLSRGQHTITWKGSWSCVYGDYRQHVKYKLTVE